MSPITASAPAPARSPSIIILNPKTQEFVDHADVQIGPWLIGALADLFLQGVLMAQTTKYFAHHTGSSTHRRFAFLVSLLSVLCILKSVQHIKVVWATVVADFADPDTAMMLIAVDWWHYTSSLTTAVIACLVQSFFVYRYWMLTRRLYICGIIAMTIALSLASASVVVYNLIGRDIPTVEKWASGHFISAIIADTLISSLTAHHLYRQKTIVSSAANSAMESQASYVGQTTIETKIVESTSRMIDRLIRMTWQSALPPTLCVILNTAVLLALPLQLTHIIFNTALPKLYAISLMYTLNVGIEMRGERASNRGISTQRARGRRNTLTLLSLRLETNPKKRSTDGELTNRKSKDLHVEFEREASETSK